MIVNVILLLLLYNVVLLLIILIVFKIVCGLSNEIDKVKFICFIGDIIWVFLFVEGLLC